MSPKRFALLGFNKYVVKYWFEISVKFEHPADPFFQVIVCLKGNDSEIIMPENEHKNSDLSIQILAP